MLHCFLFSFWETQDIQASHIILTALCLKNYTTKTSLGTDLCSNLLFTALKWSVRGDLLI